VSQLPPGHWESKEQPAGSGGKGEQAPKRQLPPGHWESKAQAAGSGGKGEQVPNRQLPPTHSESKLHLAGLAAVVPGRAWVPVAQPTRVTLPQSAAISAPKRSCLISKPSHERPPASPEVTPGGTAMVATGRPFAAEPVLQALPGTDLRGGPRPVVLTTRHTDPESSWAPKVTLGAGRVAHPTHCEISRSSLNVPKVRFPTSGIAKGGPRSGADAPSVRPRTGGTGDGTEAVAVPRRRPHLAAPPVATDPTLRLSPADRRRPQLAAPAVLAHASPRLSIARLRRRIEQGPTPTPSPPAWR
jgi:hypothetical protein